MTAAVRQHSTLQSTEALSDAENEVAFRVAFGAGTIGMTVPVAQPNTESVMRKWSPVHHSGIRVSDGQS